MVYMAEVLDSKARLKTYPALFDLYVQDCEGILMLYSITNRSSFEEIREIYEQILRVRNRSSGDEGVCRVCLVGNKSDLEDEREVETAEGLALATELCSGSLRHRGEVV